MTVLQVSSYSKLFLCVCVRAQNSNIKVMYVCTVVLCVEYIPKSSVCARTMIETTVASVCFVIVLGFIAW
jgi:hypothetical protein